MSPRHLFLSADAAEYVVPPAYADHVRGSRRWTIVDETVGAASTGFGIGVMDPGGSVDPHVHSYEESLFVLEGEVVLSTVEASARMRAGDYGLIPVGIAHALRNEGTEPVRFAALAAPMPRPGHAGDTYFVPPFAEHAPVPVDPRDPRTRSFGHIDPEHMDPSKQSQELLAVSASMRTALLVYSGITVKMMIDPDLGAQLSSMFMVQYDLVGLVGGHDHPFEETYLILDGAVEAVFDGEERRLEAGDVAWAGAGCVHAFANPGPGTVRWLETQAPQPPRRHSYRFERDWNYLTEALASE